MHAHQYHGDWGWHRGSGVKQCARSPGLCVVLGLHHGGGVSLGRNFLLTVSHNRKDLHCLMRYLGKPTKPIASPDVTTKIWTYKPRKLCFCSACASSVFKPHVLAHRGVSITSCLYTPQYFVNRKLLKRGFKRNFVQLWMFKIAIKVVNDRRERAWSSRAAHSFTNLLCCLAQ